MIFLYHYLLRSQKKRHLRRYRSGDGFFQLLIRCHENQLWSSSEATFILKLFIQYQDSSKADMKCSREDIKRLFLLEQSKWKFSYLVLAKSVLQGRNCLSSCSIPYRVN